MAQRRFAQRMSALRTTSDLAKAAFNGDMEQVQSLVAAGNSVNEKDAYGRSAAHAAIYNGHLQILQFLIDSGCEVGKERDRNRASLLHLAASRRVPEQIGRAILAQGVQVSERDRELRTPLHAAAANAAVDMLNLLLEEGADVDEKDRAGLSALLYAVRNGHTDIVRTLISHGANANSVDKKGHSAFHYACHIASVDILEVLFFAANDETVERANKNGVLPLHVAAASGNVSSVVLLTSHNDVGAEDCLGRTPIYYAAAHGHTPVLERLLEQGAPFACGEKSVTRISPLLRAVAGNHRDCLSALIAKGANIRDADSQRRNALHYAAGRNHVAMLQSLLDGTCALYCPSFDFAKSSEWAFDVNAVDIVGRTALHIAAGADKFESVSELLTRGARVDETDNDGMTALHYATGANATKIMEALVEAGANTEVADKLGRTALHCACLRGHSNAVFYLDTCSVDWSCVDKEGRNVLHYAVGGSSSSIVEIILGESEELGDVIDSPDSRGLTPFLFSAFFGVEDVIMPFLSEDIEVDKSARNNRGCTFVHLAARAGSTEMISVGRELGLELDDADADGRTPLWYAACAGNEEVADYLLDNDVSPGTADKFGITPLHMACAFGAYDVAELIIEYLDGTGAEELSVTDENGNTPLHFTIMGAYIVAKRVGGNEDAEAALPDFAGVVGGLIEQGADVAAVNGRGCTPLHLAAAGGDYNIVGVLLEAEADVSVAECGFTPLHYACGRGHTDVAGMLMESGADTERDDVNGRKPMHHAAASGVADTVRLLLGDAAPTTKSADKLGITPLHLAAVKGHDETVAVLVENGHADVNAQESEGERTPLHCAAYAGAVLSASVLVRNGGDVSIADKAGRTALHYASARNHAGVLAVLTSAEGVADVINSADSNGFRALDYAVVNDAGVCVSELLSAGADSSTSAATGGDTNLLFLAARKGAGEAASSLVSSGSADVSTPNSEGWLAVHVATQHNRASVLGYLLEVSPELVKAKGVNGNTALHVAAEHNAIDATQLLLARGADITTTNDDGRVAFEIAREKGNKYLGRLLTAWSGSDTPHTERGGVWPGEEDSDNDTDTEGMAVVADSGSDSDKTNDSGDGDNNS